MSLTVSVLQGGTNSFATTSEMVNFPVTDFISAGVTGPLTNTSGVAPATGSFAVNAQGTPDMTVAVSAGACYVTATPTSGNSQKLRVKNSASSNVTISSNTTGGTRYDWLYVKIDPDKAKDPASDASDVATLVTSRSTSSSTDNGTPPTYGTLIAVITVANGASSIANGNIADKRVPSTFRSSPATSAVNYVDIASAATGAAPVISAVGTDTNIGLKLQPKGAGNLTGVNENVKDPYKFSAYRNAAQNTGNGAFAILNFDTEDFDTGSNFDTTTNVGRFTAPIAGFYQFNANANLASSSADFLITLYKNGSVYCYGSRTTVSAKSSGASVAALISLAANDYIEVYTFCSTTTAYQVGSSRQCNFSGFLLSAT